jgi:hypothetical protein
MLRSEIIDEVRALLREPALPTEVALWTYYDEDFTPLLRSGLRHLQSMKVPVTSVVGTDGELTPEPAATHGLLLALFCAERLVAGDILRKVRDGEYGTVFRSGPDLLDTTQVARTIERFAADLHGRYQKLLTIAVSDGGSDDIVFGTPDTLQGTTNG